MICYFDLTGSADVCYFWSHESQCVSTCPLRPFGKYANRFNLTFLTVKGKKMLVMFDSTTSRVKYRSVSNDIGRSVWLVVLFVVFLFCFNNKSHQFGSAEWLKFLPKD